SPHFRLHDLAGRRRHQGWHRAWEDRRDRLPCRGEPPLRDRHPRDDPASIGAGFAEAGDPRPQAPGRGSRREDQRDYWVITLSRDAERDVARTIALRSADSASRLNGHPSRNKSVATLVAVMAPCFTQSPMATP